MRRFKYVRQQINRRTGRTYVMFRRPGFPTINLSQPIGSPEFLADYYAALNETWHGQKRAIQRLAREFARGVKAEKSSGVYLLWLGRKLVYIGSSENMFSRVRAHRANGRSFDRAFFIPASEKDRLWLERALIQTLNPQQNRNGKNAEVSNGRSRFDTPHAFSQ